MLRVLAARIRSKLSISIIDRYQLPIQVCRRINVNYNLFYIANSDGSQKETSPESAKRKRNASSNSNESASPSPTKKLSGKSGASKLTTPAEKNKRKTQSPKVGKKDGGKKKTPIASSKQKKKKNDDTIKQNDSQEEDKITRSSADTEEKRSLPDKKSPKNVLGKVEEMSKASKNGKVVKKRKRIQVIDSSDDEGHLPLSSCPIDTDGKENVKEEPVVHKSKKSDSASENEDLKDDEEKSERSEDSEGESKNPAKDENNEKPVKKVHNFFAPKEKGSSTQKKAESHSYNPSKSNYHPINDACWKEDQRVPYIALTRTLELIEDTSARLKIVEILSNYFRSVILLSPNDLLPSLYLCLNQLAPAYEGIELGVADTTLMKAIAQCTGRTLAQIKTDVQQVGDLGLVAEGSRSNQKTMFQPAPLTVFNVYTKLKEIALMTGHASLSKKLDKIQTIFVACRFTEARYLIRSLAGKLRIGLAEQSVLQALALSCAMTPPEQERPAKVIDASKKMGSESFKQKYDALALTLKTTYCECPNYDKIIPVILKEGINALPNECKITPGIPMKPMLAHPTKGIQEVLTRFEGQKFTCEWKYDGERAQIHVAEDGHVSIYSRNQENNTSKYPDIINRLKNTTKESVKSCILDCEAVAWDKEKKQILPFQVLSTRKRKDANEADIKVQVCVFMFDLLYLNGEPLVQKPFSTRRGLLKEHFQEVEGEWKFATSLDTATMEEVQDFLEESIKGNCEGLMVKTLEEDATYEIAKRSRNWLKLKKDYLDGVGDTLDLVVIGGYIGKGKRTGTYGGFLLACYDSENEEYQTLCKIGTGFSEEDLQKHTEFFKEHVIPQSKSYYRYDSNHEPDHWFEAVQVWEVKCADLSLSPVHRAAVGIVDPEKGISLRFPRFIRIRDDKNSEDATNAQQVADMYKNQEQIKNQTSGKKIAEEDFY